MEEGRSHQIYNRQEESVNLTRTRVTDSKLNSHITLPTLKSVAEESLINLRLNKFTRIAKTFEKECTNQGKVRSNLSEEEQEGLESLSKRIKTIVSCHQF